MFNTGTSEKRGQYTYFYPLSVHAWRIKKIGILSPLFSAALLLLAACAPSQPEFNAHDINGVMPDLAFELTGEAGHAVTAQDYAGKIRLLYFGFTNCPDICPTTLARLRSAINMLDPAQRKQLRVLFISVDPKRDTPGKLAEYSGYFGPRFVGLTGTQEQLRNITKRYRVTYGYGEPNDKGFYDVSHSSAVLVFDAAGKARLLINQETPPDEIAADLRRLLATHKQANPRQE